MAVGVGGGLGGVELVGVEASEAGEAGFVAVEY